MHALLINTYDNTGGAARAAFRLHQALQKICINSQMLVQNKITDDETIVAPQSAIDRAVSPARPVLDQYPLKLYKNREKTPWSIGWFPHFVARKINGMNPDLVHLHWIGDGFIPVSEVSKIKKPLIWTLHDMWAFTGGCHYAGACTSYEAHCGECPQLGSKSSHDLSSWILKRKRKYWNVHDLLIVTPSRWLAECAKSSFLFKDSRIEVIPHGVDTDIFKPINKIFAREVLNLPVDGKYILFGATGAMNDPRKGFGVLLSALKKISKTDGLQGCELLTFGDSKIFRGGDWSLPVRHLGKIPGDIALSLLYSAADVYVSPALQEAFGLTVLESSACGTPVIGSNTGGIPDIIEHKKTGYLAKPSDPQDLAEGIAWVFSDEAKMQNISKNAREKVLNNFTHLAIAQKYKTLYEQTISQSH